MKEATRKIISALIMCTVICSACACKKQGTSSTENNETLQYANTEFFSNQSCDYTIVLPEEQTTGVKFAGEELSLFFYEATGCELEIVSEDVYNANTDSKFISVGQTELLKATDVEIDKSALGTSGYAIKTIDECIYIIGFDDMGVLCGVYGFLEALFDWECYSSDEIYVKEVSESKLPLFDCQIVPTIEHRIAPNQLTAVDRTYARRLKMDQWLTFFMSINGANMGTTFAILPPATYYADHEDWYNQDVTDLCWTNEGMKAQMIENLKIHIANNPEADKFVIGQQDGCSWCTCDDCQEVIQTYGAKVATAMLCVNDVEQSINTWLNEIGDPRTMKLGVFAYQQTADAPATYDAESDTYIAKLRLNENAFVVYAPISMDFCITADHPDNKGHADQFRAWNACSDTIYTYLYGINYRYYLIDFPNWNGGVYNFKFYAENGVDMFYEQGHTGSGASDGTCWINLRTYLQAKLSYDCSLNVDQLIDDWFEHYFKGAKGNMYKYFSEMRDLEQYNIATYNMSTNIYGNIHKAQYWPKATLLRWMGYIEGAYEDIDTLKVTDPTLYEKLYNRINKESIMIRYLLLTLHSDLYTDAELLAERLAFKKDTEFFGIGRESEHGYLSATFADWGI